jgi:hypothetical protein
MKKKLTHKQLINAELATRSYNKKAKNVIKQHTPQDLVPDLVLDFYCECSDIKCKSRIPLTVEQYEKIHSSPAHFVLAKGHIEPSVEKVTAATDEFTIVKKYAL